MRCQRVLCKEKLDLGVSSREMMKCMKLYIDSFHLAAKSHHSLQASEEVINIALDVCVCVCARARACDAKRRLLKNSFVTS